jgi:hypothetical protein
MSIINKPPEMVKREYELRQCPVRDCVRITGYSRNVTPKDPQSRIVKTRKYIPIRQLYRPADAHGWTFVTPSAPGFGKCFSYQAMERSVQSI